jgi:hypothetical protein
VARQIGSLPPVASLFATVLGVNPVQHLLTQANALTSLPATSQQILTGRQFFPALISGPFHHGLDVVFVAAAAMSAIAALASLLRGGRYVTPDDEPQPAPGPPPASEAQPAAETPQAGAVLSPGPGDGGGEERGPAELTEQRRLRYQ